MDLSPHRAVCLQLLALLAQDEPNLREIESLVTRTPRSSSGPCGWRTAPRSAPAARSSSVRQAVMMVGPEGAVRLGRADADGAGPGENPLTAAEVLVRARACEIVASDRPGTQPAALPGRPGLRVWSTSAGSPPTACSTRSARRRDPARGAHPQRPARRHRPQVVAHMSGQDPDAAIAVQLAHLAALAWFGELRQLV